MRVKYPDDKTKQKKKGTNWGLLLIGAIGAGCYLWDKAKKKKKELAQAQPYTDQTFPVAQKETFPTETGSAESRLLAMGETFQASNPSARAEHKEL